MMMQLVGSFAEFERAMLRERTSAGPAVARAEGRVPPYWTNVSRSVSRSCMPRRPGPRQLWTVSSSNLG